MNSVDIFDLEKQNQDKLKRYSLDSESIKEFRSKIKEVSEDEKKRLGKELFDLVYSRSYKDSDYEKVIELIYNGADIEYKNETKGDYVLLRCARKGHFKTFLALVKAGANINQVNNYLTTASMASARHGFKEMLELLILMGADINAKSRDGDNALISARNHNQEECFKMLVRAGAHLTVESQTGTSIYSFPMDESNRNLLESSLTEKEQGVSEEDTFSLLTEAIGRMSEINPNSEVASVLNESSNIYPVITLDQIKESVRILSRLKKK